MIHKLKRKFTILATASMFVLMVVLLLIMNIVNYSSVVSESDAVLDVLSQPDAPFNTNPNEQNNVNPVDDEGKESDITPQPDKQDEQNPGETRDMNLDDFIPRGMSWEVPYESRYFTVMVDNNGNITESDFSKIISVDSDSVSDYISEAIADDNSRGFIGEFRYLKETDNVVTRLMFLDCGRKLDSFYTFLWVSIFVGLFGCLVVFVVFLLVSGRIVKPIAESYEKQKRFISDAGHEIKTPLTIINANVDLLELSDRLCDLEENEELSEIRVQTKRLTELTNNLVCLSKMEETDNRVQKIDMPVSDIVRETAISFEAPIKAKGIDYSCQIESNLSINGAPASIRQLVSILMENAVKYTPDGGQMSVALASGKRMISLSVFNTTATQVPREDLSHLFERFYRTDASRNSQTGGHGIGLSIAKAIVDLHGGRIFATTQGHMDFVITVELPL